MASVRQANWVDLEKKHYFQVFSRLPVVLVRGKGSRVYDQAGKEYLDFVSGIAVNALGHAHPVLVDAIKQQAEKLIHVSNLYYSTPQLELAELLCENSCGDRVFYANSGAETNEAAVKLAQKYGKTKLNGADEILTFTNSFHGRTMATVAATGQEKFQKPYAAMPPGFRTIPFDDVPALRDAVDKKTCAVMLEVVQGESGVNIASEEFVREVRRLCDESGALMVLDEIQTGIGRTGKFLGYQHYGVEPDVFTLAKALGGGVPIGACIATEKAQVLTPSDHGSTFGGNPLACAAGVATVGYVVRERLWENAAKMGEYLLESLKHDRISAKRGKGLMVAFDTHDEIAPKIVSGALERGLILNATGPKTVRMVPPLIITKADVDEAVEKTKAALDAA